MRPLVDPDNGVFRFTEDSENARVNLVGELLENTPFFGARCHEGDFCLWRQLDFRHCEFDEFHKVIGRDM